MCTAAMRGMLPGSDDDDKEKEKAEKAKQLRFSPAMAPIGDGGAAQARETLRDAEARRRRAIREAGG